MSRQSVVRLLIAISLLGSLAACGTSPTAPQSQHKTHDTWPWY